MGVPAFAIACDPLDGAEPEVTLSPDNPFCPRAPQLLPPAEHAQRLPEWLEAEVEAHAREQRTIFRLRLAIGLIIAASFAGAVWALMP